MMKKSLFLISFLLFEILFSQKSEPLYYDKDWKVTSKAKALYYRLMPMKELGDLVLLQDFYINGTPQFEGYALKKNESVYAGDIVWYDEDGNNYDFRQFRNDTQNLTLLYYHPNGKVRKKVQYKNGVKEGEAVIYSTDGTVLMKGIYVEGKPESGSFESVKNHQSYDYNENSEQASASESSVGVNEDRIVISPSSQSKTVEVALQAPGFVELVGNNNSTKEIKNRKTVTEKIFWINSKQIAQETIYENAGYYFTPIEQKNYDKSGKLVQSLNETHFEKYRGRILNGLVCEYYLQNNFATEIKSTTSYIDGVKSGKSIVYFPNGKIEKETWYKEGLKDGEEIDYSKDGKSQSKRIYKEDKSFQGNFNENVGAYVVNLNYVNGLKEGEAIALDDEKQIVAKGIYKNGKPFNGTFVEQIDNRSNGYELIKVENFKKKGLQKVFGYRLENLNKTYTVDNDKLNGLTSFYNQGKVIGVLEYKDGEPHNGELVGEETLTVYKNGKMVAETYFEDSYNKDKIQKQKFYENEILVKVKDYSFTISEKPQDFYEGILKNGKPFSGYFETEINRDIKQVDYFENGTRKFQYSNDYLKNMDNYNHQTYNIKSTYKEGKIFDGIEYVLNENQFISRYWKNGVLQSFDWDLFAVHYFNRIHFELKNNTIRIKDLDGNKTAEIMVENSKNGFKKQFIIGGEVADVESNNPAESKKKQSIIIYYKENGKIASKTRETSDRFIEPSGGVRLLYRAYLFINETSSLQEVFNKLSENIINGKLEEQFSENTIDDKLEGELSENQIIAGVLIDAQGNPKDGILITPTQNNIYTLRFYAGGKLVKSKEKISASKIEEEVKNLEK